MVSIARLCACVWLLVLSGLAHGQSRIETWTMESDAFAGNLIGIDTQRPVEVYLPDGYFSSGDRYPVLYALHDFFERSDALFGRHDLDRLLDEAIAAGTLPPVIVVVSDYGTPAAGSLYTKSPVTGDWPTFIADHLVDEIDRRYRTLDTRDSRGIFGYHIGGYGAIRIASRYPETFGSVYALHPVATGVGNVNRVLPDWEKLLSAKTQADLDGDWVAGIFTSIFQAHMPDPANPPFYYTPYASVTEDGLVIDPALYALYEKNFFLESEVAEYADALKSLNGFKFDWGRHDPNQDHVVSNHFYTRKLRAYGIDHEADEYNGGWGDRNFVKGGRVETDLFPFFARVLVTE